MLSRRNLNTIQPESHLLRDASLNVEVRTRLDDVSLFGKFWFADQRHKVIAGHMRYDAQDSHDLQWVKVEVTCLVMRE